VLEEFHVNKKAVPVPNAPVMPLVPVEAQSYPIPPVATPTHSV